MTGHPSAETPVPSLAGFTVGLTATRRVDELASLVERRGGAVVRAPAMRLIPLADDTELAAATRLCIARPPDLVISMTGVGLRGWLAAAEGWELAQPLLRSLGGARLVARGPKSRAAFRAVGLADAWSPQSESSAGVLDHLLGQPLAGRRVAVQLHGEPQPDFVGPLRAAGAEVIEVPVYRWTGPEDPAPLAGLVAATCAAELDAVTFTSAPAATAMLAAAEAADRLPELLAALHGPVVAACVGPVSAGPLAAHGVPTLTPERFRLVNLIRRLEAELGERTARLPVAGPDVEVRGTAVAVDGRVLACGRAATRLLRALARRPDDAVPAPELVSETGEPVEAVLAELRANVETADLVHAVEGGYRLARDAGRTRTGYSAGADR